MHFVNSEVGIYKRKQESDQEIKKKKNDIGKEKKKEKDALDQESKIQEITIKEWQIRIKYLALFLRYIQFGRIE